MVLESSCFEAIKEQGEIAVLNVTALNVSEMKAILLQRGKDTQDLVERSKNIMESQARFAALAKKMHEMEDSKGWFWNAIAAIFD